MAGHLHTYVKSILGNKKINKNLEKYFVYEWLNGKMLGKEKTVCYKSRVTTKDTTNNEIRMFNVKRGNKLSFCGKPFR